MCYTNWYFLFTCKLVIVNIKTNNGNLAFIALFWGNIKKNTVFFFFFIYILSTHAKNEPDCFNGSWDVDCERDDFKTFHITFWLILREIKVASSFSKMKKYLHGCNL